MFDPVTITSTIVATVWPAASGLGVGVGSCACVSISEHRTTPIIVRHNPASANFFMAAAFLAARLLTNFPNINKNNPEVVRFTGGLVRRGRRTVHARRVRSPEQHEVRRRHACHHRQLGVLAAVVRGGELHLGVAGANSRRKRALTALADSRVNLATGRRNRPGQ